MASLKTTQTKARKQNNEDEVFAQCWFHGNTPKQEIHQLFEGDRKNGDFLIRQSYSRPDEYTLCISYNRQMYRYEILHRDGKYTTDEEIYFNNLDRLVEFYSAHDGYLVTKLNRPIERTSVLDHIKEQKYFVDHHELEIGEIIGKGEFGEVHLGILHHQKVAIKLIRNINKMTWNFPSEISLMTCLRHPNIVQMKGVTYDESSLYLITEYMGNGNLVDYLRSRGRLLISKRDQIKFASDICAGMDHLESKKIIHRDLAARNILISDEFVAKIGDFGLAKDKILKPENGKIPVRWTAPEALRDNIFTTKSDVWSFGVLLWEIYSFGQVPYPRMPSKDILKYIEHDYRMGIPEGCPEKIYEIMTDTWNKIPEKRPTFSELNARFMHLLSVTE